MLEMLAAGQWRAESSRHRQAGWRNACGLFSRCGIVLTGHVVNVIDVPAAVLDALSPVGFSS